MTGPALSVDAFLREQQAQSGALDLSPDAFRREQAPRVLPRLRGGPSVRADNTRFGTVSNPNATHLPEPVRSVADFLINPALDNPLTTAASVLIAPVGVAMAGMAAKRVVDYGAQKAAELTLPEDTRAIAEADPERISGREAATLAGAFALAPLIHGGVKTVRELRAGRGVAPEVAPEVAAVEPVAPEAPAPGVSAPVVDVSPAAYMQYLKERQGPHLQPKVVEPGQAVTAETMLRVGKERAAELEAGVAPKAPPELTPALEREVSPPLDLSPEAFVRETATGPEIASRAPEPTPAPEPRPVERVPVGSDAPAPATPALTRAPEQPGPLTEAEIERHAMQEVDNPDWTPPEPEPVRGLRTPSGRMPANITKAPVEHLGAELLRLAETNGEDAAIRDGAKRIFGSLDYAGDPSGGAHSGDVGMVATEASMKAGGRVTNRQKSIAKIEAELARRGIDPGAAMAAAYQAEPRFSGLPSPAPLMEALDAHPAVAKLKDALNVMMDPAARSPEATKAAGIVRAHTGDMARTYEQAAETLDAFRVAADKMPEPERLAFIDRIETGQGQPTKGTTDAAATIRKTLDTTRDEIRALGTGKLDAFIENYFPHIWEDPAKAEGVMAQFLGKRPLGGAATFLKKREIPTTREGIEAGLKPVTTNPVDLTLLKLREMQRYLMAQRVLSDLKEQGLAEYIPAGSPRPDGYVRINDKVATVFGPPEVQIHEAFDAGVRGKLQAVINAFPDLTHERKAKIGGADRWGYARGNNEIVTKFGGDNTVIEHELGHIIDNRYGLWKQLTDIPGTDRAAIDARRQVHEELRALADLRDEGSLDRRDAARKNYVRKRAEKMANAVHALIYAPERMDEVAPTVKAKLTAIVQADPMLRPILDIKPSLVLGANATALPVPGLRIMGEYWAPEPVARILNNYLSPGLRGNAIYDAFRGFGNTLNQAQLGLSAFHLGFTSMDAAVSRTALGLEQLVSGKVIAGAKSLASTPLAPFTNIRAGAKLRAAYLTGEGGAPKLSLADRALTYSRGKPGTQAGDLAALAQAVADAGGRVKMDSFYRNSAPEKFMEAWRQKHVGAMAANAVPAFFQTAMKPIMEYVVPRQKLGVFGDLAREALSKLPEDAPIEVRRKAMADAWDSVDNRLGQLVYDNLFWDKTFKDLAMASVRSVGWNLGTIREIGGGLGDVARGKWTHRTAYIAALPITVGLAGAVTMYLYTGHGPTTLKDYFYPQTGTTDADGNPNRVQLPSYMKDVAAYANHPWRTIGHKVNPALSIVKEMLDNEDFYGDKIRNPNDPLVQQLAQSAHYFGEQFLPFTARNVIEDQKRGESRAASVASFVGVTPANRETIRTPAQNLMTEFLASRQPKGATPEQVDARDQRQQATRQLKAGDPLMLQQLVRSGAMTMRQAGNSVRAMNQQPLVERFKRLTYDEAEQVFDLGSPAEKKLWQVPMLRKRVNALMEGRHVNLRPVR